MPYNIVDVLVEVCNNVDMTKTQALTKIQRLVLDQLELVDGDEHARWITCRDLAERVGRPPEGVSRTVGSLIDRGLAERATNRGVVYYRSFDNWCD